MNNQNENQNNTQQNNDQQMSVRTTPKSTKKNNNVLIIVLILVPLFALTIVYSIVTKNNDTASTSSNNLSSNSSETVTESFVESDYAEVDYLVLYANQSEYINKKVKICGKISSIDKNITNGAYITIKEGISGFTGEIYCNLATSESEKAISNYKEGDYVEIAGKVGTFVLKSLNLDDCYVTSSGESVKEKIDNYALKQKEQYVAKLKEESEALEKNMETFKNSCESYAYKEIARNPNNFIDKHAKFEGQVIQVMENGDDIVLRVNITKEANEFAEGGYLYSDTIYVEYTKNDKNESRILEDDIITLYGTLKGTKTYDTIFGSSETIPYYIAEYIDIHG